MHEEVHEHVRSFFAGHPISVAPRVLGKADEACPGLAVLHVGPGPRTPLHTYVSVGVSAKHSPTGHREFFALSPTKSRWLAQVVAMVATYHVNRGLDVGHTLPIGEPWQSGSALDHILVSTPYTFGEELEDLVVDGVLRKVLWLLPITQAEKEYRHLNGLEALECRFEEVGLDYADPSRTSVV